MCSLQPTAFSAARNFNMLKFQTTFFGKMLVDWLLSLWKTCNRYQVLYGTALAPDKIWRKSLNGFPDFYGQFVYELRTLVASSVNTAVVYGKLLSVTDG